MAPLKPTWHQPSHSHLLHVSHPSTDPTLYSSLSLSVVDLPAGAVFTTLTTPPLTPATKAYSTVQISPTEHIELNSDLVYINHSCKPSLVFDMDRMEIRVGEAAGIKKGQELTFFYPSSEWSMEQSFLCSCGEDECVGWIRGAGEMERDQLKGHWFNPWVEQRLAEKWGAEWVSAKANGNGVAANGTANGNGVAAANGTVGKQSNGNASNGEAFDGANGKIAQAAGGQKLGASARELAGEMGGDTK